MPLSIPSTETSNYLVRKIATPILGYGINLDAKVQEPKPRELKTQDNEAKDENGGKKSSKDLESEDRLD